MQHHTKRYVFAIVKIHQGKEYFLSQLSSTTHEKVWTADKKKSLVWDQPTQPAEVIALIKTCARVKGITL